jgi:hypothetical protein
MKRPWIDAEFEVVHDPRPEPLPGPRRPRIEIRYPLGIVSKLYGLMILGLGLMALSGAIISEVGPRLDPHWNDGTGKTPYQACRARTWSLWGEVDHALSGTPLKRLYTRQPKPGEPIPVPSIQPGGCF